MPPEVAAPKGVPLHFSVQGLVDTLMTEIPNVQLLLAVEFTLQLEVMMADCPECPCPLVFSWNASIGHAHTQEWSHAQGS